MLKPIADLPEGILGFSAIGRVSARDYRAVLAPAVTRALRRRRKMRFLYVLGPAFTGFSAGAVWQDTKLGLRHPAAWQKIAVVSDLDWIRAAVNAFRIVMPGHIKVFPFQKMAAAKTWIKA